MQTFVTSPASRANGADAKGEERPERVFLPQQKDPIRLRPNSAELFLLAGIRDEAHRFAITHHKKLRRKRTMRSGLDDIPGIGAKRKRELLRALGSLKQIRQASLEQLETVPGMTTRAVEAVAAAAWQQSISVWLTAGAAQSPPGRPVDCRLG